MVSTQELISINDHVDDRFDEIVDFLQDIVQVDSTNPPGDYEEIHQRLVDWFGTFDISTETLWAPNDLLEELQLQHPRPTVLGHVTDDGPQTIGLRAHYDTVPVDPDNWTVDPFGGNIKDGRLYGRGATDEKSQIAAITLASIALSDASLLPVESNIVIICEPDEETDGKAGAKFVTESGSIQPDYLIGQGTLDGIWNAGLGGNIFEITIQGKASHAGIDPNNEYNPISGLQEILSQLYTNFDKIESKRSPIEGIGSPTHSITMIHGGNELSVIPERLSITVDQRVPPGFSTKSLAAECLEGIGSLASLPSLEINTELLDQFEPYYNSPDSPHVKVLQQNASEILNKEINVGGTRRRGSPIQNVPAWPYRPPKTHYYESIGTKSVNFGPGRGGTGVHGGDEFVELKDVREAAKIIAASILDISRLPQ